jgi:transcriptional regulator with XRE-family HTH domain
MPNKTYAELSAERRRDPETAARIDAGTAELLGVIQLRNVRDATGLTQTDIADKMGITQKRVSAIERAEDLNVSTLERYVAALGGRLEVQAAFGDRVVPLTPQTPRKRVRRTKVDKGRAKNAQTRSAVRGNTRSRRRRLKA